MSDILYKLENVSKIFGHETALDNICMNIPERCFLAITGPNGSGKSTLLRLLAFIIKPSKGKILIKNELVDKPRSIGFVSHQLLLYNDLTVRQNLNFFAGVYSIPAPDKKIKEALDIFKLGIYADKVIRDLSRGQQQRAAIARSILHNPEILIMDEPFTGLDVEHSSTLDQLLKNLHESGINIIFTSHDREYSLQISNSSCELCDGKITKINFPT